MIFSVGNNKIVQSTQYQPRRLKQNSFLDRSTKNRSTNFSQSSVNKASLWLQESQKETLCPELAQGSPWARGRDWVASPGPPHSVWRAPGSAANAGSATDGPAAGSLWRGGQGRARRAHRPWTHLSLVSGLNCAELLAPSGNERGSTRNRESPGNVARSPGSQPNSPSWQPQCPKEHIRA